MENRFRPEDPDLRKKFAKLYREFFDLAERKRRWSLNDDIPWSQVNRSMNPAVADIVESFCAVELYLPDYIGKALPMIRANRGWAWFHANWGYEESKHSLALGDWLLRSGQRTEEQMADLEDRLFQHEWNLPHDSPSAMVMYGMVQELATWASYRNLRLRVQEHGGDPALSQALMFLAVDERAHHSFYLRAVQLFLEIDRAGALEQLRRVFSSFAMPAVHLIGESRRREEQIRSLGVLTETLYMEQVVYPILEILGVERRELRKKVVPVRC